MKTSLQRLQGNYLPVFGHNLCPDINLTSLQCINTQLIPHYTCCSEYLKIIKPTFHIYFINWFCFKDVLHRSPGFSIYYPQALIFMFNKGSSYPWYSRFFFFDFGWFYILFVCWDCMTPTQAIRDLFAKCSPSMQYILNIECLIYNKTECSPVLCLCICPDGRNS